MAQLAYKFDKKLGPGGKLELTLPEKEGTPVEVLVLSPNSNGLNDLLQASESSLEFWDNPLDDEDWNVQQVTNCQSSAARP